MAAEIANIDGLSGHADRSGLLEWLDHFEPPPRKLFLTHGEEQAAIALGKAAQEQFGFDVTVPEYGFSFELDDTGPSRSSRPLRRH